MSDFPIGPKTAAFQARIRAMVGKRFSRLTVLGIVPELIKDDVYLVARCDCGVTKQVLPRHLRSGDTRSCGCLSVEIAAKRVRTHGMTKTPIYGKWCSMLFRCDNANSKNYKHYGGRGISVCDRWRVFESFLADVGQPPTAKHEIDRINNDGNYEPGNVRWALRQENAQNTRRTRLVTARGETRCLSDWSRVSGLHQGTISRRLERGCTPEDAIFGARRRTRRWRPV